MKTSLTVTFLALISATAWAAGEPTDPQIAAIVVTANQVDIDAGQLAESKAQNAQVHDFAQLMVKFAGERCDRIVMRVLERLES